MLPYASLTLAGGYMKNIVRFAIAMMLCCLPGCGGRDSGSPVDTDNPQAITATIEFEMGLDDDLMRPAGATRLASGNVVVVDIYRPGLSFYDRNGKLLRQKGRKGFGPAEFQAPGWVRQCGRDSLYVFDELRWTVTVFDTAGNPARAFPMPMGYPNGCSGKLIAARVIEWAERKPISRKRPVAIRDPAHMQLIDFEGDDRAKIENMPMGELGPIGRNSGSTITRNYIWYSSGDSAWADLYSHRGRFVKSVPLHLSLRKSTREHVDVAIESIVMRFTDELTRNQNRELLNNYAVPEHLPLFQYLIADVEGERVWVSRSFAPDSVTQLRGYSEDGRVVADLTLPRLVRLLEIGENYVLGAYEPDGQPRVALFRFQLAGPQ